MRFTRVKNHNMPLIYMINRCKMENSLLSLSPLRKHQPNDEWRSPERSKIHGWYADSKSYSKITDLERSTIQCIIKARSS